MSSCAANISNHIAAGLPSLAPTILPRTQCRANLLCAWSACVNWTLLLLLLLLLLLMMVFTAVPLLLRQLGRLRPMPCALLFNESRDDRQQPSSRQQPRGSSMQRSANMLSCP